MLSKCMFRNEQRLQHKKNNMHERSFYYTATVMNSSWLTSKYLQSELLNQENISFYLFRCCCCLFGFNVALNNFAVISRRCLVASGSSVLTFIVLPHGSITPQTPDMIQHPVLTLGRPVFSSTRKHECQARSR